MHPAPKAVNQLHIYIERGKEQVHSQMGCEATDLNISDLSLIEKVLDRLVQVNPAGYIDMTQAMDIIKKRT